MRWRVHMARIGLSVATSIMAVSSVSSAEETLRLDVQEDAFEQSRSEWFGIYSGDDKLGFMSDVFTFDTESNAFVIERKMHLKVVTLGQRREVKSTEVFFFDGEPPYKLTSGQSQVDQGPFTQRVDLEQLGDGFEARITAADSERILPVDDLDYTVADVLTPTYWFRDGRQPGESVAARSFSITDLASSIDTYSITGLKETLVDGVGVDYYEVDLHSSVAGSLGTVLVDVEGLLVSGLLGGVFEIRRESEELARDFDYAADLYLLGLAQIDEPLGDPRTLSRLNLMIEGKHVDRLPTSARQGLTRDTESDGWLLTLGTDAGTPQAATPEQVAEALEESVEYPIHEAEIVDLAREAIGSAEEPVEQAVALVKFVDSYLQDSYSAEPLTVLDMLETRKGDCTEHALLFTTLARAVGLPTREVTGLLYLGDDAQAFGGHAWNEVALDGYWHQVDATWGEYDINAGHILLGPRSGDGASAEAIFGGYSFQLIDLERH